MQATATNLIDLAMHFVAVGESQALILSTMKKALKGAEQDREEAEAAKLVIAAIKRSLPN